MSADVKRINLVWVVLVLATLASWWTAEHESAPIFFAAVMIVAALKIRLILWHFMDLKDGPLPWRIFFDCWAAACAAIILGVHWYSALH
mgnify:CR=1 FL=1